MGDPQPTDSAGESARAFASVRSAATAGRGNWEATSGVDPAAKDAWPLSADEQHLLHRVEADVKAFKLRTAIFSAIALLFVLAQITTATFATMLSISQYLEMGYVLSGVTALLVTMESTLGIRERAASAFATVQRLEGIRLQLVEASFSSSPLWQEYSDTHASRRLNYIEGLFISCAA